LGLTALIRLVTGVLQTSARAQTMKMLTGLIIIRLLYCYAAMKTKFMLEGPNRVQICDFDLTRLGCGLLSQFGVQ
jgi:hypothetical protein